MSVHNQDQSPVLPLALGALGIVFGDIGTSPVVALTACLHSNPSLLTTNGILGIISMIFWALILVVSVKYLLFITRAESDGEGGIFAIMAILKSSGQISPKILVFSTAVALIAAALLMADSMLTPALAMLSAVEGLKVSYQNIDHWILITALALIAGLFSIQRLGTGKLGQLFGPIMLVWFVSIAILGIKEIIKFPQVLIAFSPQYAIQIAMELGTIGTFSLLGSVMIAVTGAEAIYADMGHFGMKPIKLAWYFVALIALLLNYFGQGAWLLQHLASIRDNDLPFFALAPEGFLIPLVLLATFASIIASQAVISGMFSLSSQAIQLGFLPRLAIIQTSASKKGQIYLPKINFLLATGALLLTYGFGSSASLANAYGLAVAATMFLTTVAFTLVVVYVWKWSWKSILAFVVFAIPLDCIFLAATITKIPDGSYVTLIIAALFSWLMLAWMTGNRYLTGQAQRLDLPIPVFVDLVCERQDLHFQARPAVFFQHLAFPAELQITPNALLRQVQLTSMLYQPTVIVEFRSLDLPRVNESNRIEVRHYSPDIYHLTATFGFAENINMQSIEALGLANNWWQHRSEIVYYTAKEQLRQSDHHQLPVWIRWPYWLMHYHDQNTAQALNLPTLQYVELNLTIDI